MNDAIRRAIRTFIQGFLGNLVGSSILSGVATRGVVDWSGATKVGISALAGGVIALISFVQNALEDSGTIPAVLKQPPPDA